MLAAVMSAALATPSPANCVVPKWPMIAESANRNRGSATESQERRQSQSQDLALLAPGSVSPQVPVAVHRRKRRGRGNQPGQQSVVHVVRVGADRWS